MPATPAHARRRPLTGVKIKHAAKNEFALERGGRTDELPNLHVAAVGHRLSMTHQQQSHHPAIAPAEPFWAPRAFPRRAAARARAHRAARGATAGAPLICLTE